MAMSPGYGDKLLTAPTFEPVLVQEIVSHSRLITNDVDALLIAQYITAAREYLETRTKRAYPQQQWQMTLDQFPGRQVDDYRPPTWRYGIIRLPRPPLISVDEVAYIDPSQSTQPFTYTIMNATTDYMVDLNTEPGRVAPAPFLVWPATNPLAFAAVRVKFTCGYTAASLIPQRAKQAIRMLVDHLYSFRGFTTEVALSKIPYGLDAYISAMGTGEYA